jgi:hypothetical protein
MTGIGAIGTVTVLNITADTNILTSDIEITSEMVSPGGGGIIRLYFSFLFGTTPAMISVFNNGILKGNLNADNSGEIITDGYYRFDIDVESGDNINIQSSEEIISVNFIRAHLVQFGA